MNNVVVTLGRKRPGLLAGLVGVLVLATLGAVLVIRGQEAPVADPPPATPATEAVATALAQAVTEAPIAVLPATVTPPATGRAVVTSPFEGQVVRVHVLEGQSVRAGQPIAELFSPEALRVSTAMASANAEVRAASRSANRTRALVEEGIIAGARAQEADDRLSQAQIARSEQERLVAAAGVSGGRVTMRAPISGRVSQINLRVGESAPAGAPAAIIDESGAVWIEARLPGDLVGRVAVGDRIRVGDLDGRVIAVGATLDAATRSVVVRASLDSGARLALGALVEAEFWITAPAGAVEIPRSALTRSGGKDVVLARRGEAWEAVEIQLIGRNAAIAVVTGLAEGRAVATADLVSLKASLGL